MCRQRIVAKVFSFVLASVLTAPAASAIEFNWTGFYDEDWTKSGNWLPFEPGVIGGPPGTNDSALVDGATAITPVVLIDTNTAGINGLKITNGALVRTGAGRLLVDGSSVAKIELLDAGSTLRVAQNILNPNAVDVDTDLLTAGSGTTVDMRNGILQVDSGPLVSNSGAMIKGWGEISLENPVQTTTVVFNNNGLLKAGRDDARAVEVNFPLMVRATDPQGTLDLDGSSGNGQLMLDVNTTLTLDGRQSDAFSDLITIYEAGTLDIPFPFTADASSTLHIDADGNFPTLPSTATIRGGPFTTEGLIEIVGGALVLDTDFHATSTAVINADGQGLDTAIRINKSAVFDAGSTINMAAIGPGTTDLSILGQATFNGDLNLDSDGNNVVRIGIKGLQGSANEPPGPSLTINGGLQDAFSSELSLGHHSALTIASDWTIDHNGSVTVQAGEGFYNSVTIGGGPLTLNGFVNVLQGRLYLDSNLVVKPDPVNGGAAIINVGGVGSNAGITLHNATFEQGGRLNMLSRANLDVDGKVVVNQPSFDLDSDEANSVYISHLGSLTLNVDQLDSGNSFDSYAELVGKLTVNLSNSTDHWMIGGLVDMGEILVPSGRHDTPTLAGSPVDVTGRIHVMGYFPSEDWCDTTLAPDSVLEVDPGSEIIFYGNVLNNGGKIVGGGTVTYASPVIRWLVNQIVDSGVLDLGPGEQVFENGAHVKFTSPIISGDPNNPSAYFGRMRLDGGTAEFTVPYFELAEQSPGGPRGELVFDQGTFTAIELLDKGRVIVEGTGTGIVDADFRLDTKGEVDCGDGTCEFLKNVILEGGMFTGNRAVMFGDIKFLDNQTVGLNRIELPDDSMGPRPGLTIVGDNTVTINAQTSSSWERNVDVGQGTLEVHLSGQETLTIDGSFVGSRDFLDPSPSLIADTVEITGKLSGSVQADVGQFRTTSVISPGFSPGVIHVTGDYEQTATGTYEAEIGGLVPGDEFDHIFVEGQAVIDGALEVLLLEDFSPALGDSFEILTADGGVSGMFDSSIFPSLDPSLDWELLYNSNDVTLAVISASPGDFDVDGDRDGRDFLVWQRGGSPNPLSSSDLADWEANFGAAGSLATSQTVPEPSTFLLAGLVVIGVLRRKIRIEQISS